MDGLSRGFGPRGGRRILTGSLGECSCALVRVLADGGMALHEAVSAVHGMIEAEEGEHVHHDLLDVDALTAKVGVPDVSVEAAGRVT